MTRYVEYEENPPRNPIVQKGPGFIAPMAKHPQMFMRVMVTKLGPNARMVARRTMEPSAAPQPTYSAALRLIVGRSRPIWDVAGVELGHRGGGFPQPWVEVQVVLCFFCYKPR